MSALKRHSYQTTIAINCWLSLIGCDPETIQTESGITYIWPQTNPSDTANFMCPFDSNVVTRRCGLTGNWEAFDQQGCRNLSDVVDQLENLFSNVCTS